MYWRILLEKNFDHLMITIIVQNVVEIDAGVSIT